MTMDLKWLLSADDQATPAFVKVGEAGKAAANDISATFNGVMSTFNLLPGAIGGLAAIAGGLGFKNVIDQTVNWNLEAAKLSVTLGSTPEAASVFMVAMHSVGVDSDLAGAAALRLSKNIVTHEQVFTDLGVKVKDANGKYRDTISVMMDVNTALKNENGGFDRNTIAMQLYGRSWGDVQQLMKVTNGVMTEAEETATRLNLKVGQEGVQQALEYKKAMRELDLVGESLKIQLGVELLPIVIKIAETFGHAAVTGAGLFSDAIKLVKSNSVELEVTLAALAAPRILAGLGSLASAIGGMGGAGAILGAAQAAAMANPITAGVVIGGGIMYEGYKAIYGPEEEAAYAALAKDQAALGVSTEKLTGKLKELGFTSWDQFDKAEKAGEVVFNNMTNKWVVKPKVDATDFTKNIASVAKDIETYGKSINNLGKTELDLAKNGFSEDLKTQQSLLKTNALQMGTLEQPLRSYLAVIEQVYSAQTSAQKAVGQALFSIGATQKTIAQQNVAIATTEKGQAEANLNAWSQYLVNLKAMHATTVESMKKKQQELFDINLKTGDLTLQIQQSLMTPMQKYFSTMQDLDNKQKLAMSLNSDEKIKLLSSVQDKWGGLTGEIKDGDKVLLSGADAAATALSKVQTIGGDMANEKAAQIAVVTDQLANLDLAMKTATDMVSSYQTKIKELDGTIAALTRTFDLTMTDAASPVINQVKSALDLIKDKTVTITANYVSAYSASGSGGGESIPQYASGTPFVPRTGLALIHQGEKIVTAKDNASGNYGGNTITLQGGISVTIQGNGTSQQTAAEIAKQVYPELQKLTRRQS